MLPTIKKIPAFQQILYWNQATDLYFSSFFSLGFNYLEGQSGVLRGVCSTVTSNSRSLYYIWNLQWFTVLCFFIIYIISTLPMYWTYVVYCYYLMRSLLVIATWENLITIFNRPISTEFSNYIPYLTGFEIIFPNNLKVLMFPTEYSNCTL